MHSLLINDEYLTKGKHGFTYLHNANQGMDTDS